MSFISDLKLPWLRESSVAVVRSVHISVVDETCSSFRFLQRQSEGISSISDNSGGRGCRTCTRVDDQRRGTGCARLGGLRKKVSVCFRRMVISRQAYP